jgi:hypothetical protein
MIIKYCVPGIRGITVPGVTPSVGIWRGPMKVYTQLRIFLCAAFLLGAALDANGAEDFEFSKPIELDPELHLIVGELSVLNTQEETYQENLTPFGAIRTLIAFQRVYKEKVKLYPKEQKVEFLWTAYWILNPQGEFFMEIIENVTKDCPELFEAKLRSYLRKARYLGRNSYSIYHAESALVFLMKCKKVFEEKGVENCFG